MTGANPRDDEDIYDRMCSAMRDQRFAEFVAHARGLTSLSISAPEETEPDFPRIPLSFIMPAVSFARLQKLKLR